MIDSLHLILDLLGALMILLVFYIVLFKVYYATEGDRPWWIWPAAVIFLILDVGINILVMPILCLDPVPVRFTVTARMKRYKKLEPTQGILKFYRHHMAVSMCQILNVFDKGHC